MRANLDKLRRDVIAHLEDRGLVVFKCFPRSPELISESVYWDIDLAPDFREFVSTAEASGTRIVTVFSREFSMEMIDEPLAQLQASRLDRDTHRSLEGRLREFTPYEGFVCEVELSFSHNGRTYIFDQPAEWFEELNDLIDQIEEAYQAAHPEEGAGNGGTQPLGGYYSNN